MTTIGSRPRALLLALHLLCMGALALPLPASAMQILDAADHAELAAEISATGVNRIALAGDRIAKVVRPPAGFAVEHDARSGDLYLRPVAPPPGAGSAETDPYRPVTLFVGTEKGFTYRLTLTPADRDSAQILIRNAAAAATGASAGPAPGDTRIGGSLSPRLGGRGRLSASREGSPHVAALVRLVRAVARREPLPGYEIRAGGDGLSGFGVIETWRGPRFRALVLEADTLPAASARREDAAGLAGTIADALDMGRLAAVWLAAPGTGPSGGRLAVAVTETAPAGEPR